MHASDDVLGSPPELKYLTLWKILAHGKQLQQTVSPVSGQSGRRSRLKTNILFIFLPSDTGVRLDQISKV
jgi:hypothetical protein